MHSSKSTVKFFIDVSARTQMLVCDVKSTFKTIACLYETFASPLHSERALAKDAKYFIPKY